MPVIGKYGGVYDQRQAPEWRREPNGAHCVDTISQGGIPAIFYSHQIYSGLKAQVHLLQKSNGLKVD